jgi:hypothetical protein
MIDRLLYRNFRGRKLLRISRIFDHQRKFSTRNLGRGIPKGVWYLQRGGVAYITCSIEVATASYVATRLAKLGDCDVPAEVLSAELHATKA